MEIKQDTLFIVLEKQIAEQHGMYDVVSSLLKKIYFMYLYAYR